MIHYEQTIDIQDSPDRVWAVLASFMTIDEFAPLIVSVDALTGGEDRVGSTRRCIFEDGTSVVEKITKWEPENNYYSVKITELASPVKDMQAEFSITELNDGVSRVNWSLDYSLKFGPFGWLLGQTMLKIVLGKVVAGNLNGLVEKVESNKTAA